MATEEIYGDSEDQGRTAKTYGDPEIEPGKLLSEKDEKKVAEACMKLWKTKNQIMQRREAQWEVNELRRRGFKNVQLRQETDDRTWKAWIPPHLMKAPDALSALNKAAELCRKFVSIMLTDPPAADPIPTSGEDEDRDAAEFSGRVLQDLDSPAKLNEPKLVRRAFDRASTFGSGFVRYYIHPTAGGRAPIEISAGFDSGTGRRAERVEDAITDPTTGLDWPEFQEMFVYQDGTLGKDESQAATRFRKAIKAEVLTGRNVRMIPHTAEDIWDADGVQVAAFRPWGELKKMIEGGIELTDEQKESLFAYKPERYRAITTPEERQSLKKPPEDDEEKLVFTLTTYYKACNEYEKGVYILSAGDEFVLDRQEWSETDEAGKEISLMLPLTQYAQWAEGTADPYKFGMMDLIGEGNEIRAQIIGANLDWIDWSLNRKTFLPMGGMIRPQDLKLPGRTTLPVAPGEKPSYEEIPSFPSDATQMIGFVSTEMDQGVNLGQAAQGLESSQVQSGKHAQAIVAQAHAALSEIVQNIEDGYIRGAQIKLQLVRAYYDAQMTIGWVGEDGAYKQRAWSGADLRQTTDVRLKPGTLTMLSPVQKAALAQQYAQFGLIGQEDMRDIAAAELGGTLGLQDDAFTLRVRRQVATFLNGPPKDWQPQFEQQPVMGPPDPATGQPTPVVDPMTGQPQMQPQQIMDPVLLGIWRPYPADELPYVARTRLREIAKAMASSKFAVLPQEWQFGMLQEFQRMNLPQQGAPGMQVGQPPNTAQSPAQRTQGPMAPAEVPKFVGPGASPVSPS